MVARAILGRIADEGDFRVAELDSATDEARIQEIYNTILTTMADQCLTTPLIYTRQLAIYSDAVASYTFPTDASFTSVQNIHLN